MFKDKENRKMLRMFKETDRREEKGEGGSLGNIEEMMKRKRENVEDTAGEKGIFRISKKILRSPNKEEGGERGELGG